MEVNTLVFSAVFAIILLIGNSCCIFAIDNSIKEIKKTLQEIEEEKEE
jgi:flavin-binding protein dodecin